MITIKNRNLFIPESEKNLGFYGDNLRKKVEFLITDSVDENAIFRLYLTFDNGLVNFLLLSKDESDRGLHLVWNVEQDHIYKSGVVTAQIKAFEGNNVIWHTTSDTFVVSSSPEESLDLKHQNAEFLQYEKKLNELYRSVQDERTYLPYIGENGNWFLYDVETKAYKDSGVSTRIENPDIADGAVTPEKLDRFYTEALSTGKINSYAELDDILTPEEGIDPFKTLFKMAFSEQFPNAMLADGNDYIGFVSDRLETETPTLILINTETFDKWVYIKGSGTVTEIESAKFSELVPRDLTKFRATNMLGGNYKNTYLYVYDATTKSAEKTSIETLKLRLWEGASTNPIEFAGSFGGIDALKKYEFTPNKVYLAKLVGYMPNGLSNFGFSFVTYNEGKQGEEYVYRHLNCVSIFSDKYATVNFLSDEVTVTDNASRIETIENTLDGLEEFLATI